MIHGRNPLRLILVGIVVMAVLAPMAVLAAGGKFTDDDTSMFEVDIEWMADAGITQGCNPPANDNYCPNSNVTRGQMAVFMHRLAVNGVVDAAKLGGEDPSYYESLIWANDVDFGPVPEALTVAGTAYVQYDVEIPTDGYLLLNSSVSIFDPDTDVQTIWWIQVDQACINTPTGINQVGMAYASVYANHRRQSASITGGYAVDAGTHTLRLCGGGTTSADVGVHGPSLSAVFSTRGSIDM